MKAPCELVVWYVLPTIRAELAKELKELGLTQKEISERLGVTQAAISQYMKEKRGQGIPANKDVRKAIKKFAKNIKNDKDKKDIIPDICLICAIVKSSGSLCDLHRKEESGLGDCNVCL
jgi:predicted transcriptional regulator